MPDVLCPVTKQTCYRTPQCKHDPEQLLGDTMCAEWVLKQQKEGERIQREKQNK